MLKRNKQIDGVRGITAIIILVFHLFCRYLQIYENANINWMAQWGTFGVTVFILISGYFLGIENTKDESSKTKFNLIKYLKKKILRLWSCYIIAITITMIIIKIIGLPGRECSWFDYILNVFFINGFIGMPYVDGAHWYLTTLISIIVVIGIIRKIQLNNNIFVYCIWLIGICTLIKLGYGSITVFCGGAYLGIALTGFALAKFAYGSQKKFDRKWILLFILSILFCFIIQGINGMVILFLGLLVVVPCLLQKLKIFENPIFLFLGKISYPLYLIHQNLGFMIIQILSKWRGTYKIEISIIASICVLFVSIIIFYSEKIIIEKLGMILNKNKKYSRKAIDC